MCGFIGALRYPFVGSLDQAMAHLAHRGPDDSGRFYDPAADLQIGFVRLAILDLSLAGRQPMQSEDGQLWIAFNGEIYNFLALRAELAPTCRFRSGTDTEVLLHGYRAWGLQGLLSRVEGMFAFALWDAAAQRLILARDRFGKKPLYYAHHGGLCFGSTLPAMLSLMGRTPSVDPIALDQYLTYLCVPAPRTIYEGIAKLPAAHYAIYDCATGALALHRYWELSYRTKEERSEREWLDLIDAELRRSVRQRLIADVPVCAFLSGGVDSSLVVALMAQESSQPVTTVSIGFADQAFDETAFAAQVARQWGTAHHAYQLEPAAFAMLPELAWHYGEPFADSSAVPSYHVAKLARNHATVALNGDGGDELFGGYAGPVVARAAQQYRRLPLWLREQLGARLAGGGPLGRRVGMLTAAGRRSAGEAFIFDRAFRSYRAQLYSERFWGQLAGSHPDEHYRAVWDRADGPTDADRVLYGDLNTYLPDELLVKMDVASMAHSLEARSPLLDTALAELAARIPAAMHLKGFGTKYLLKRLAERYLPRAVIHRPKKGFNMPVGPWLRGPMAGVVAGVLLSDRALGRGLFRPEFIRQMITEHQHGARDWSQQLWSLLMLELWFQLFMDRTLTRNATLSDVRGEIACES